MVFPRFWTEHQSPAAPLYRAPRPGASVRPPRCPVQRAEAEEFHVALVVVGDLGGVWRLFRPLKIFFSFHFF